MDENNILDELLALLGSNNVAIRSEPLGGTGGGLCTVKNNNIFFFDTQASAAESATQCAQALSNIIDIEKIYIRPEVRLFIQEHSSRTEDA